MNWNGFRDRSGAVLRVGDLVRFHRNTDGYRGNYVSVSNKQAPFEGKVCGFAGDCDVVIEIDGSRYSNHMADVEKLEDKATAAPEDRL